MLIYLVLLKLFLADTSPAAAQQLQAQHLFQLTTNFSPVASVALFDNVSTSCAVSGG